MPNARVAASQLVAVVDLTLQPLSYTEEQYWYLPGSLDDLRRIRSSRNTGVDSLLSHGPLFDLDLII